MLFSHPFLKHKKEPILFSKFALSKMLWFLGDKLVFKTYYYFGDKILPNFRMIALKCIFSFMFSALNL
jgi:hypothetical protein